MCVPHVSMAVVMNIKTIHQNRSIPHFIVLFESQSVRLISVFESCHALAKIHQNETRAPSRSPIPNLSDNIDTIFNWALSLSSILSLAAAAATPPPAGYAILYTLADCIQAYSATGLVNPRRIALPEGSCVDVDFPLFLSCQGGVEVPCPSDQKGQALAFLDKGCTGPSPVSSGLLPPNGARGDCQEVLLGSSLDNPQVGGKSLFFICVDRI